MTSRNPGRTVVAVVVVQVVLILFARVPAQKAHDGALLGGAKVEVLRGDRAVVFVVARERSLEVFDRQPIAIFAQEELRDEAPRVEGESAVVVRALRAIVSVFYENRVVTELDERVVARAHGEDRDLVGVIQFVGRRDGPRDTERHHQKGRQSGGARERRAGHPRVLARATRKSASRATSPPNRLARRASAPRAFERCWRSDWRR